MFIFPETLWWNGVEAQKSQNSIVRKALTFTSILATETKSNNAGGMMLYLNSFPIMMIYLDNT